MQLHDFRVISFDCYGTLIDWESGIATALAPLMQQTPSVSRSTALETFARHERIIEATTPALRYSLVLAEVYRRVGAEWGARVTEDEAKRFAASIADWPAFEDTPAALQYLKQHFQLVILSNVDRAGFAGSARHLGVAFDAVFVAEEIGSYKPNPANFRYLLSHLAGRGVAKAEILHTAQSLYHDHVPAKRIGLACNWIDRRTNKSGFGATPAPSEEVHPDFHFPSLAAMVEAHRAETSK